MFNFTDPRPGIFPFAFIGMTCFEISMKEKSVPKWRHEESFAVNAACLGGLVDRSLNDLPTLNER